MVGRGDIQPLIYQTSIIYNNNLSTFVLILSDKCSLWLSSRKHLYATDGDYYRKSQSKCIVVKPNSHGFIDITLQHGRLRKCCGWGGRKISISEDKEFYYKILSSSDVRSYTQSHQHDCQNVIWKSTTLMNMSK